jgi:hypothetical protein
MTHFLYNTDVQQQMCGVAKQLIKRQKGLVTSVLKITLFQHFQKMTNTTKSDLRNGGGGGGGGSFEDYQLKVFKMG